MNHVNTNNFYNHVYQSKSCLPDLPVSETLRLISTSLLIFQMILAEITHRLTPFLNQITIQIYKDDRSLPKSDYVALTLPTKQTTSGIESPLYDDFQFKNISIESNRR